MARIIVDTSALIEGERTGKHPAELVASEDDVAVAAITIAEMLFGAELAAKRHARVRFNWIDQVLATFSVEEYGIDVARVHAKLLAHSRRSGRSRGAHDLIVAATALAKDRTVVTLDRSGFEGLPGVEIRT